MLCAQQTAQIRAILDPVLQEIAELFGEASTDGELESELADNAFGIIQPSEQFSQVTKKSAPDVVGSSGVCDCW